MSRIIADDSPMNRTAVGLALVVFVAAGAGACSGDGGGVRVGPVDLYSSVDPFIGTGGLGFGVGSTYPGPALPFAMIHAGPDTRLPAGAPGFSHCSGYWWEDTYIEAFSLVRMNGTGVPDYGVIGFMPVDGMTSARVDERGYATPFSHDDERAEPGYYRVLLASGIAVEITSTLRAAMFRFTFPGGVDPVLLVDLQHTIGEAESTGGTIDIDPVTGAMRAMMHNVGDLSGRYGGFDLYAAAELDVAPQEIGVWDETGLRPGVAASAGIDLGGWLRFPEGTTVVTMRVAVSFVDADGAAGNLAAEMSDFDFDGVRASAAQTWRDALSVVQLDGATERDGVLVATALYHALLMPSLMSDADGRVRDVSGEITTTTHDRYSDFSLWDTYRTLHPWLLLTEDEHNEDFAASLYAFAEEGGAYPRWSLAHGDVGSMIGSPADMVMAESALKGVPLPDPEKAYQYARATAYGPRTGTIGGRTSITEYLSLGYVPDDSGSGSVAKTMEYSIADHALSGWAASLGHDEDAAVLAARAGSWKNLFDSDAGFIRPKMADGTWARWTGPLQEHDAFTEGNAWQYLWMVPHDIDGLAQALGGRDAALTKLRVLFDESLNETPALGFRKYYWHGNEPDIIAPWIFAALGEPSETWKWVDWIVREHYGTGPDGLPGNDDGGTLSAWLLFASAGIYPIAGTDRYIVAAPRQALMVLRRASGDLRIEAEPNPLENPRILAVSLDGQAVDSAELTHAQLVGAHVLRFTMGR